MWDSDPPPCCSLCLCQVLSRTLFLLPPSHHHPYPFSYLCLLGLRGLLLFPSLRLNKRAPFKFCCVMLSCTTFLIPVPHEPTCMTEGWEFFKLNKIFLSLPCSSYSYRPGKLFVNIQFHPGTNELTYES